MKKKQNSFTIIALICNKNTHIDVVQLETTDSVAYYSCLLNGREITQIRKEVYGNWEQLWGQLDYPTVQEIGTKIIEKTRL